jgi:hypothetical protein
MNYNYACHILNLSAVFTDKELKQSYYIKALQYHPDKNDNNDAKDKFQEILDAYNYLNKCNHRTDTTENEYSYFNILENFICNLTEHNIDIKHFLSILNNKYTEISLQLLKKLSKETLLKFHTFIKQYNDILHINSTIYNALTELVKDNIKNDIVVNITPSLENLINDEIYKLVFKNEIYYIPLWHHELIYDISNTSLIIECKPDIPDFMTMDCYNNLYISLSMTLTSILNQNSIDINIIQNKYTIPIDQLYIKKQQRYMLSKGISQIDTKDIYNVNNRANIYVDIHFTDVFDPQ